MEEGLKTSTPASGTASIQATTATRHFRMSIGMKMKRNTVVKITRNTKERFSALNHHRRREADAAEISGRAGVVKPAQRRGPVPTEQFHGLAKVRVAGLIPSSAA